MMFKSVLVASLALLPTLVAGQCQPNILMDDFKKVPQPRQFFDGADRYINLLNGDYGGDGVNMDFSNVQDGYMTVTPTNASNFFFFKANREACYDLTKITALRWDMEAPAGADSTLTLTVMQNDCVTRDEQGDSVYLSILPYTANKATNGQKQTFVSPMRDFATKANGGAPYDFVHFKDFTFVNMKPVGAPFKFYFFEMIGNCGANGGNNTTPTTNGGNTTPTGTTTRTTNNTPAASTTPTNTDTTTQPSTTTPAQSQNQKGSAISSTVSAGMIVAGLSLSALFGF